MPEAGYLSARILVRGASTVGWSGRMKGPRSHLGFPRVVERELVAGGQPAEVRSFTVGGMPTSEVVRTWERDVVGWSPDVVIYMVGHYETLHALWPNWLERHANNFNWLPRTGRVRYRRSVLRPVWRALVKFQTLVDTRVPAALTRRRVRNAVKDVRHAVTQVREIQSPLVIVMEAPRPGSIARRLFPGMQDRLDSYNRQVHEWVGELGDPEVRVFRTNAVLDAAVPDRDAALPDGFHFSEVAHDAVGRALTEAMSGWLREQPHLRRTG